MVKKIAFALAAIGISSAAFAGHPGDAVIAPTGINLMAPDSVGVWSVGLEALYMTPTNSDFQYTSVVTTGVPTSTASNKSVNNSSDWGGTIDVAYMFPGNSRDVKLSYTHLDMDNSSTSNTYNTNASTLVSPFGAGVGAAANTIDGAKGSSDQNYNSVDLVFGQWVRIGDRLDLHPFGGLRYSSIDVDNKGSYTNSADATDYSYGKIKSDFSGIGPRAGLDAAVHVGSGISITGTVGASLLVGDIDAKVSNNVYTNSALVDGSYSIKNNDSTHVVPELDARLGVNYTYNFNPATALGVELGYQAVNYFDAVDTDFIDATTPNTVNNSEDFGYHGPYLRVQLSMA